MSDPLEISLAKSFRALGDPTRVKIYRYLVRQSETAALKGSEYPGTTVSEVAFHVEGQIHDVARVSFHLKTMREGQVIEMRRSGRFMFCRIAPGTVNVLKTFLDSPP